MHYAYENGGGDDDDNNNNNMMMRFNILLLGYNKKHVKGNFNMDIYRKAVPLHAMEAHGGEEV
jgi:hypothetical protein